jgi:ATP-dependent Clp protease ATP-binding subunit ClpA
MKTHILNTFREISTEAEIIISLSKHFVEDLSSYLTKKYYQPNISPRRMETILNTHIRDVLSGLLLEFHEASTLEVSLIDTADKEKVIYAHPVQLNCEGALSLSRKKKK